MDNWIPVTERLPKEDGEYLVTYSVYGTRLMRVLSYSNNLYKIDKYDFSRSDKKGFYNFDSEYGYSKRNDVIAWQPLPSVWKGENNG